MKKCEMCPRKCGVNREKFVGFCGEKSLKVSHVMLHHWEEPLVSGALEDCGSGTIFFTGCNLKCVYCQNQQISQNGDGKMLTTNDLVTLFKNLENAGALNINLVTPTHFTDQIIEALKIYKPTIPVIWNTSGYESAETIYKLKGLVDVFLTDIKYFSGELSRKYSNADNYFEVASEAVKAMRQVVGEDVIQNGLIKKGIIIRHMVLPNNSSDSVKILEWVYNNLGKSCIISIMNQYTPCNNLTDYPEINKNLTKLEYKRVINKAISLGFKTIFAQDNASASKEFIPQFENRNVHEWLNK